MTEEEIDAWVDRQIQALSPESKRRAIEVLATFLRPDFQALKADASQGHDTSVHFAGSRKVSESGPATATHISVKQLAERWSCPLSTVYRQVETLKIPALRIGQAIRIPLAAVERFEAENTTGLDPNR